MNIAHHSPSYWLTLQAQTRPDDCAIYQAERPTLWTFAHLAQRVGQIAAWLTAQGIPPGSVLGHACHEPLDTLCLLYAAWQLGIAVFPYNPALPTAQLQPLLQAAHLHAITGTALPENLPAHLQRYPWPHAWPDPLPFNPQQALPASALHLLIATSGTSGSPKAVALHGDNLCAAAQGSQQIMPLKINDRWLSCLPLFHIGGVMIGVRSLFAGSCVHLHPRFNTDAIVNALNTQGITHISLVPALLARLLEAYGNSPAPPSLRVALIGGGPLAPALARRAHAQRWPLCVSYGMTETSAQCATDCSPDAGLQAGCVGYPLPGIEIRAGQPQQPARIEIRGAAVTPGYRGHPARLTPDGFWPSSDLGFMDVQGRLWVVGRADDVLISGGENIHPEQLEALLRDYPAIHDAAVCGRPDPVWGQRVVAFLVTGADFNPHAFAHWCKTQLPSHLRPREWHPIDHLPRTPTGKLQRSELTRLLTEYSTSD